MSGRKEAEMKGHRPMKWEVLWSKKSEVIVDAFVEKLSKKAYRIGQDFSCDKSIEVVDGRPTIIVTFDFPLPKIEGWSVVGFVDRTELGARAVSFAGCGEDVSSYAGERIVCDHCGTNRKRKKAYILSDGNEMKMVGSTCIRDYTGVSLPFLSTIEDVDSAFSDFWDADDGKVQVVNVKRVADVAAAVIRVAGGYEKADGSNSTVAKVKDVLFARGCTIDVTDSDKDFATKALDFGKGLDDTTSWSRNAKLLSQCESISPSHVGILASVVGVYHKEINKRAVEKSEWAGEVGDKVSFEGTVKVSRAFDTAYGVSYLNVFVDDGGNMYKWFTSTACFEVGDSVCISGKIKGLDTYGNVKQTVLTRCKVLAKTA